MKRFMSFIIATVLFLLPVSALAATRYEPYYDIGRTASGTNVNSGYAHGPGYSTPVEVNHYGSRDEDETVTYRFVTYVGTIPNIN